MGLDQGRTLRAYQHDLIRQVFAQMRAGHARVVGVLPTGTGKTITAVEVVRRGIAAGRRVLWIAHRTELIEQAARTLRGAGLDVGVCAAGITANPDALVQVASIQTLCARASHRPPADLIVWDEAHHCAEAAEQWIKLLADYPDTKVFGLTATPERGDGSGLAPIFTALVVGITTRKATEDGHLVPCEVIRPATWLKAKRAAGNPLAMDPVEAWRTHAMIGREARPGFLFARSVEEAEGYARALGYVGIRAACIHAGTSTDERNAALDAFRAGIVRVLCNVFVFTEGTDLPAAEVCCLARGAGTAGGFLQMVGRVLRTSPGKRSALLIDLQGTSHVHGMPEDERAFRLEGKAIVRLGAKCAVCSAPIECYPCPACGYEGAEDGRDGGSTEITGDKLAKFARMIAQGPEQRRETLWRWMKAAHLKGYKPGSVRHKWKAVYGEDPDPTEYRNAVAGVYR